MWCLKVKLGVKHSKKCNFVSEMMEPVTSHESIAEFDTCDNSYKLTITRISQMPNKNKSYCVWENKSPGAG